MRATPAFLVMSAKIGRADRHPLLDKYPAMRESPINPIPCKHFINLTNGIETMRVVRDKLGVKDPMFVRLQSSLCEQTAYEKILAETDHNLLMHLATGHNCYVYDLASRSKRYGVPRAIWYGLEFIKFSCAYCWFGEESELIPSSILLRGKNVAGEWRHVLRHVVSKGARQRLKYYREYVQELGLTEIRAYGVCGRPTIYDGCKDVYAKMLRDTFESDESNHTTDGPPGDEEFLRNLEENGLRIFDFNSSFEDNLTATQNLPPLA